MNQRGCLLLLPALTFACGANEDAAGDEFTSQTLAAYRRAIPAQERLLASEPGLSQTGALTRSSDAVLADYGVELARAVNRPVRGLVGTLRALSELEPSYFDAAQRRFVWGPWDNERRVGKVALIVAENDAGADFEYSYMLVRSPGEALDGATPVILGGATPDVSDPELGVGVALWDLEANRAFEAENGGDPASAGRGRFVTLFGHDSAGDGEAYFNLAAFRSFVPGDAEAGERAEPLDVDYFYGRYQATQGTQGTRIDFVDSDVLANLCGQSPASCFSSPAAPSAEIERFEYGAYFVDRGLGRAEVRLSEGDLAEPAQFVECWSPSLERTSFQVETGGAMVETLENGSCTAPADQSAAELGLPTLDDIDRSLLGLMSCAAENGAIGCP
jgi:hypothetical protein